MTRLISEVDPIFVINEAHPTEENLPQLVEEPLLEACIRLVRKNIRTLCTSANKENIGTNALLIISASDLSEKNTNTAKQLGGIESPSESHWGHSFSFTYPLNEESTITEVSKHFNGLADKFSMQPYTWVKKNRFADYLRRYVYPAPMSQQEQDQINESGIVENTETGDVYDWAQITEEAVASGAYYDVDSGFLYDSKEEYDKEQSSKDL